MNIWNGANLDFSRKLKKKSLTKCEWTYNIQLIVFSNPSVDSIPVLHMERIYIGAVEPRIIIDIS